MEQNAIRILFSASVLALIGCTGQAKSTQRPQQDALAAVAPTGLVLAANEGERRIRRGVNFPFIIKVDSQNGGSPDLVMLYEDLPPGQAIPAHHHLLADEILFVEGGTGVAQVGTLEKAVGPGSTVYIPRNTRITLRNSGATPLTLAAVFSKPGFEQMLREASVREGETVVPLSQPERTAILDRAKSHTVYDQTPSTEKKKP